MVDLLALSEYIERFPSKTIVVLGDFVADAFQFGDITRVSREAPVLILRHRETEIVPGAGLRRLTFGSGSPCKHRRGIGRHEARHGHSFARGIVGSGAEDCFGKVLAHA